MNTLIKVNNVFKSYGKVKALNGISFDIEKGSFISILGPNGAGKSTINNILSGLMEPTTGSLEFEKVEDINEFKRYIGMVFQQNICDDLLTVKENLLFRGSLSLKNEDELNKRYAELKEFIGFSPYENQRFKTLSGGQKRIIEITSALFLMPRLLILDEPTTGLDPKNRKVIWGIIDSLRKKGDTTIILTTHYLEEAIDSDQIIIINNGIIEFKGSPNKLIDEHSVSRTIIEPIDSKSLSEYIDKNKFKFTLDGLKYTIYLKNSLESIKIIKDNSDNIKFIQVLPGTIDDAYLNIIGESHE